MKSPKVVSVVAILILLIAAVPLWSVSAGPADKVGVCHMDDLGGYILIQVSSKALPAHLSHGDGLPGNPVPNMDGYMFAEDCSLVEMPPTVIFNSIPDVLPGSFPSLGYEATSTDEFGDHITFADVARDLKTVDVSLTDWACENDATRAANEACITTPGSFYTHPITLNIYSVKYVSGIPAPDTLLGSVTQTFNIPYRPSYDSANCSSQSPTADAPFGGTWFDPVLNSCVHGYAFVITFDFDSLDITLPNEVIYGVAYNTAHHGATPLGINGPYNSLNVSLASVPPFIGTDYDVAEAFWDTSYAGFYCDGGSGGVDIFRRDAENNCWSPYTPVIRFNAGP